jgi:hypothetical protein
MNILKKLCLFVGNGFFFQPVHHDRTQKELQLVLQQVMLWGRLLGSP